MPRLIAIAEMVGEPARIHAIAANNRTHKGVVALKRCSVVRIPSCDRDVVEAIRAAYARARAPESLYMRPRSRFLLDTDFPDLRR